MKVSEKLWMAVAPIFRTWVSLVVPNIPVHKNVKYAAWKKAKGGNDSFASFITCPERLVALFEKSATTSSYGTMILL